jgi:hypothetical protein
VSALADKNYNAPAPDEKKYKHEETKDLNID